MNTRPPPGEYESSVPDSASTVGGLWDGQLPLVFEINFKGRHPRLIGRV